MGWRVSPEFSLLRSSQFSADAAHSCSWWCRPTHVARTDQQQIEAAV